MLVCKQYVFEVRNIKLVGRAKIHSFEQIYPTERADETPLTYTRSTKPNEVCIKQICAFLAADGLRQTDKTDCLTPLCACAAG